MRHIILSLLVFFIIPLSAIANTTASQTLSLSEAILLAVRENPNVQTSKLNSVLQKYAREVEEWQFSPHFALQAQAGYNRTTDSGVSQSTRGLQVTPEASLLTPIGTQINVMPTFNIDNQVHPGLSLQVMQPLIRGFGKAVVESALFNARDNEVISHLNVEGTLRTTVTNVIIAYLNALAARKTIEIDQDAVQRAELSVEKTKLFIKAGRKAGVELITVQSDVANAKTKLENDKNNYLQSKYALLTAIGIDPNTDVSLANVDIPALMQKYQTPSLEETKSLVLMNDIQYQIDQITLHGSTKRNVLVAKDNTRWQLNLTTTASTGSANSAFGDFINGNNQSQGVMLNLTIPIDDRQAKTALSNAKIALQEAEIALRQEEWQKETNAITSWNSIQSAERALEFAKNAERLQQRTYKISFQKYQYGLIDSIELQAVQQQLIAIEQGLVSAEIAYLNALVNLDLITGNTLKTWNIGVRYD